MSCDCGGANHIHMIYQHVKEYSRLTGARGFPIVSFSIFGEVCPLYIRVSEIPREGLDVIARRGKAWVPRIMEGMDPFPLRTCGLLSAGLVLTLEGRNLFADGSFVAEGEATCDRCTEAFRVTLEKEFHAALVPGERGRPAPRRWNCEED